MRRIVVLLAALALPLIAQIPLPTAPTKFVTDAAGVIPDDRELALNERLAELERTTTHQIIVYVDRTVPEGTTLEEMGAEAIRTWAVGQEKRDNGAILFLFIDSRDSRIEVGYGLEGTLTDAMSKRILVDMRPLLRSGDYAGAVEQGATAIFDAIITEPPAPQAIAEVPSNPAQAGDSIFGPGCVVPFGLLMILFLIVAMARNGSLTFDWSRSAGGRLNDDSGSSSDSSSSWNHSSPFSSSDSSFSSSDSSSSSSNSSSSSSSNFSGGGGSGGGGGASDKW